MRVIFLFGIIVIPGVEFAVFVEIGDRIGLWPTLSAVFLTAIAGVALLRRQGLTTLQRAKEHLERGRFPVNEVFDGLCLLVAGAFLLIPGFVTDSAGLLLFFPPVRAILGRIIRRYLTTPERLDGRTGKTDSRLSGRWRAGAPGDETIIDGDYQDITSADRDKKNKTSSGDTKSFPPFLR
ncbi:MAG: FxsA family protein [Rhodospirillales bacterium]